MLNTRQKQILDGFSLFEILVTIGILLMITVLVIPITAKQFEESKAKDYASQITADIYYQQQTAKNKNIATGIYFENSKYILFEGDSLATSTSKSEKTLSREIKLGSIALGDSNSILFPAGEFKPSSFGTFNVITGSITVQIYINQEGLIGYEPL